MGLFRQKLYKVLFCRNHIHKYVRLNTLQAVYDDTLHLALGTVGSYKRARTAHLKHRLSLFWIFQTALFLLIHSGS